MERRDDAAAPQAARDASPALRPLALGLSDLAGFGYRGRSGQPAFRLARASEAKGAWAEVAAHCRQALAADPGHLDAAYLYAVALAKTGGDGEQIAAALGTAVAGDYATWGAASLAQPALQPFLASALGGAWRRRVEQDRDLLVAALARSVIVTAQHDLYAYDGVARRWFRLTRTGGAVVGALHVPSQHQIAYVTRARVTKAGRPRTRIAVGIVELATGRTRRAVELPVPASAKLRIGYTVKGTPGFIVRAGKLVWQLAGDDALALRRVPAKAHADAPAHLADMMRLEVAGRQARIDRAAVPDVTADWDDHSLASAIKIGRSQKVVTVPSPGLIDGDTATWSADRTQLAFIAELSDECAPGIATAAAFVADAATGRVHELERAVAGIAIEWYGDRTLAIAGDHGVSIVGVGGSAGVGVGGDAPVLVSGADGLVTPRRTPTCVPPAGGDDPVVEDEDAR